MGEKPDRDVEKIYSTSEFVAKLRRLADALETGERFEIQVAGERVYVPAANLAIKCAAHSGSNVGRKIWGRVCPRPIPLGFHACHKPDFPPSQIRLCVAGFMARFARRCRVQRRARAGGGRGGARVPAQVDQPVTSSTFMLSTPHPGGPARTLGAALPPLTLIHELRGSRGVFYEVGGLM